MVKPAMPAATRTAPEAINIFFSFMGRRYPPLLPTSYVERRVRVPGFSQEYREYVLLARPDRLEDKGRNPIPCLNSSLPNLKLGVPYGEYRATYAQG